MSRHFEAAGQEEDSLDTTFPNSHLFHNHPEGLSRLNSRDVNDGETGRFPFPSFNGDQSGTLHSYRPSEDSALFREESPPPGTTTPGIYTFPDLSNALPTFPETPSQDLRQTGSFSGGVTDADNALTSHLSGRSNLPLLLPAPSSSHIAGQRFPTSRRNHSSGSTSDPVQASAVGPAPRRSARKRLSASSVSLSASSARGRYHPYVAPNGFEEAGYGNYLLPPSAPAQPVGLQRVPSGSNHQKLFSRDFVARCDLLRDEPWLEAQIEEPAITPTDEFRIREYISSAERTRFCAFVGTNPSTRRVACRITHDVTVDGQSVACTYEAESAKDTIAHVALLFGYNGYKCQSQEPGHPCEKMYPTPERRNDHHSKVKKGADSQIACEMCGKITWERNMGRHMRSQSCRAASAKRSK